MVIIKVDIFNSNKYYKNNTIFSHICSITRKIIWRSEAKYREKDKNEMGN